MATATLVPLEEYLHTMYHPDCEWVDGELKERHLGEGSHAALQKFFMKFFLAIESKYGLVSYPELRTQVSKTNFRVPDVLLLRDTYPLEDIVTVAPILCIEILSPDDRMSDMHEKIDDYLKMGVEAVWVVDPRRRTALFADSQGTRPTDVLELPGTDIRVSTVEMFAELDRLRKRFR